MSNIYNNTKRIDHNIWNVDDKYLETAVYEEIFNSSSDLRNKIPCPSIDNIVYREYYRLKNTVYTIFKNGNDYYISMYKDQLQYKKRLLIIKFDFNSVNLLKKKEIISITDYQYVIQDSYYMIDYYVSNEFDTFVSDNKYHVCKFDLPTVPIMLSNIYERVDDYSNIDAINSYIENEHINNNSELIATLRNIKLNEIIK